MIAKLYEELPVERSLIEKVQGLREAFNRMLDSKVPVTFNGQKLTRRLVFEMYMWGKLAHANKRWKQVYDSWLKDEFTRVIGPMLEYELTCTLVWATDIFAAIRAVNLEAIAFLRKRTA